MKLLNFLVESFVGAFGITKPKPEQQRTVALALGGFLLVFFTALFALILWMRRSHNSKTAAAGASPAAATLSTN